MKPRARDDLSWFSFRSVLNITLQFLTVSVGRPQLFRVSADAEDPTTKALLLNAAERTSDVWVICEVSWINLWTQSAS